MANKLTNARITRMGVPPVVDLGSDYTLKHEDIGKIFRVLGAFTILVPSGLARGFAAGFIMPASGTVTFTGVGPVELNGGTSVSRDRSNNAVDAIRLQWIGHDEYMVSGSFAL